MNLATNYSHLSSRFTLIQVTPLFKWGGVSTDFLLTLSKMAVKKKHNDHIQSILEKFNV